MAFVVLSLAAGCDEAKAADTGDALGNTVTDLSVGANYLLSILRFRRRRRTCNSPAVIRAGTTLTINGAALNFGTLNDLDATQLLTISNASTTAGSLTLNTAANSTTGANASDLLYVAAGGNLKIQSGAGTLTLNIVTSGNIDNAGTLNIAAPLSIAALTRRHSPAPARRPSAVISERCWVPWPSIMREAPSRSPATTAILAIRRLRRAH